MITNYRHETTISAIQNTAEAAARIFEPQLQQERARDFTQPPPHWPQAFDAGIIWRHGWQNAKAPRLGT